MSMWIVSAISLGLLLLACLVAPFVQSYRDNLLQRISFALIFIGTFARWLGIIDTRSIEPVWPIIAEASVVGNIGFALFAVGTAYKVWRHRHEGGSTHQPGLLDRKFFRHVHGRGPSG